MSSTSPQLTPTGKPQTDHLPEEVLLSRRGHGHFHAPAVDEEELIPVCRIPGEYRKKDRKPLRGTRDPCSGCFTDRVVDEWDPEAEWE